MQFHYLGGCFEDGFEYVPKKNKNLIKIKKIKKANDCQALCAMTKKCAFFYTDSKHCYLVTDKKASKEEPKKKANKYTAGPATCPPSAGLEGETVIPEGSPSNEGTAIEGTSGDVEG